MPHAPVVRGESVLQAYPQIWKLATARFASLDEKTLQQLNCQNRRRRAGCEKESPPDYLDKRVGEVILAVIARNHG